MLNGNATELVQDDTSGAWHLKDDNASKVVRLTGGDSNDENGEYWQLTTSDGTTYTFGLNKLSGAGSERTNSVWTVPVFGDDSGEPGYSKGTEFKDRSEVQAWRWNLDQVPDVHGNASTYSYAAEDNHYAKNGDTTALAPYTRGGRLEEIRYGQRSDTLFTAPASDKITFWLVRDVLPGPLGGVGRLSGHLQCGGDLLVGGVFQALHRDVGAGVVEVLRLREGGVEDFRLGKVSGRRTGRGDQRDGHRPRPRDHVGELPGHVRVQRRRAQQQARLMPAFGHLVCFEQAFAQIAQCVCGLPHVGDPCGGQQLRQVLAEPHGDDFDFAGPRAHAEFQRERGAHFGDVDGVAVQQQRGQPGEVEQQEIARQRAADRDQPRIRCRHLAGGVLVQDDVHRWAGPTIRPARRRRAPRGPR
ncbi:hypothetical protein ADL00_45790 [Streptomyces sp. AS58]|nr:hypothetical protein ADL00_45790 [Streptomyces sp. AS58]